MLSKQFIVLALVGAATAFTPSGFALSSANNLTVAFGNVLAINGKDILRPDTVNAPTVGTSTKLFGSYTVMMVDLDIPPSPNSTNQRLHWLQSGFTSADMPSTVAGIQTYPLVNTGNTSAFATYAQPSPPNLAPLSHRYTQLLLNTTGNSAALAALQASATPGRQNYSAVDVITKAGLTVLAGNWFNVTNTTGTATSSGTSAPSKTPTSTAPAQFTNGVGPLSGDRAFVAGLGALGVALAMF